MSITLVEVLAKVQESYGFEATGVYCLCTGKRIGTFEYDELEDVFATLPDSGELEMLADDFALRLLASMRPSMRWNKMRVESIAQLRKTAPIETMAYLLIRLMSAPDSSNGLVGSLDKRIHLFARLKQLDSSTDAFRDALYKLVDIDARLNLLRQPIPFAWDDLLRIAESVEQLDAMITPWHDSCVKRWMNLENERKFREGNGLTRQALYEATFERKPPSMAKVVKERKRSDSEFMTGLLRELVGETRQGVLIKDSEDEPAPKPVLPMTRMPAVFAIRKKD